MALRVFPPCYSLSDFVESFWDYDNLTGNKDASLSILPDTATYLCFIYSDRLKTTHKNDVYETRSGLAGFQVFRSDLSGDGTVSGVSARLTPYGLHMFRRGIVTACAGKRVDCRDVFHKDLIEQLEERLAQCKNANDRVTHVEDFLLSTFSDDDNDLFTKAVCNQISSMNGICRISRISKMFDVSKRTMEQRFRQRVGVTPKTFARVVRLRYALNQRRIINSWAEIAHISGYYDQSHMIHEFIDLYGFSPEELYPRVAASTTFRFSGLLNLQPA